MVSTQMSGNHNNLMEYVNTEEIKKLANKFAAKVPEKLSSPAEILSFLLEHKKSPVSAILDVEDWVQKAMKATS